MPPAKKLSARRPRRDAKPNQPSPPSLPSRDQNLGFICVHLWLERFFPAGVGAVFQDVPRLAVQVFADRFERGETDGARLAGFEDGEILRGDVHAVGEVVQAQLALGEDDVEVHNDWHRLQTVNSCSSEIFRPSSMMKESRMEKIPAITQPELMAPKKLIRKTCPNQAA